MGYLSLPLFIYFDNSKETSFYFNEGHLSINSSYTDSCLLGELIFQEFSCNLIS